MAGTNDNGAVGLAVRGQDWHKVSTVSIKIQRVIWLSARRQEVRFQLAEGVAGSAPRRGSVSCATGLGNRLVARAWRGPQRILFPAFGVGT